MAYSRVRIVKPNDSAFGLVLEVIMSTENFVVVATADGDKRTFERDEVEWEGEAAVSPAHPQGFFEGDTCPDASPITPPAPEYDIPNEIFDEGGVTAVQPFITSRY